MERQTGSCDSGDYYLLADACAAPLGSRSPFSGSWVGMPTNNAASQSCSGMVWRAPKGFSSIIHQFQVWSVEGAASWFQ